MPLTLNQQRERWKKVPWTRKVYGREGLRMPRPASDQYMAVPMYVATPGQPLDFSLLAERERQ